MASGRSRDEKVRRAYEHLIEDLVLTLPPDANLTEIERVAGKFGPEVVRDVVEAVAQTNGKAPGKLDLNLGREVVVGSGAASALTRARWISSRPLTLLVPRLDGPPAEAAPGAGPGDDVRDLLGVPG